MLVSSTSSLIPSVFTPADTVYAHRPINNMLRDFRSSSPFTVSQNGKTSLWLDGTKYACFVMLVYSNNNTIIIWLKNQLTCSENQTVIGKKVLKFPRLRSRLLAKPKPKLFFVLEMPLENDVIDFLILGGEISMKQHRCSIIYIP